jgi:putative ABC transport system ATP-binding protein
VVDRSGWAAPGLPERPAARPLAGAPDRADAVVIVDRVTREYRRGRSRVAAIEDLEASIGRGGLHVVTGTSGSGKSTLLRLVVGLDRPTSGSVMTLGSDLAALDRSGLAALRAGRIATMSQAPRLVPFLSVVENVELGLDVRRSGTAAERRDRAMAALDRVGLAELASSRPDVLSGGERARTSLARAIAPRPDLVVLDEPTAALDRTSAIGVIDLLGELAGETTVIAATHDRDLIAVATDRLDLRDAQRGSRSAPGAVPGDTGMRPAASG